MKYITRKYIIKETLNRESSRTSLEQIIGTPPTNMIKRKFIQEARKEKHKIIKKDEKIEKAIKLETKKKGAWKEI